MIYSHVDTLVNEFVFDIYNKLNTISFNAWIVGSSSLLNEKVVIVVEKFEATL